MKTSKHFASDNYAGVHPEILAAIAAVNTGHSEAYGDDESTERLQGTVKRHFGETAKAFPVFNGTAANVIALQSQIDRWGAVICTNTAHINVDEAGAPERVGGIKLLTVPGIDGKLTPEMIRSQATGFNDVHRAQPMAVSISQTTELGTCYTTAEIAEIANVSHEFGMILHMDGSRISNAAAHLGLPMRAFTTDAGVDILSLGATKNGALGAEAIVLLSGDSRALEFLRKMNLQLASKMRFISAQLNAMFEGDLWITSAKHANNMALLLRSEIEGFTEIARPTESNAVFVKLSEEAVARAQTKFKFYDWATAPGELTEYRLMCAFDTDPQDVRELAGLIKG